MQNCQHLPLGLNTIRNILLWMNSCTLHSVHPKYQCQSHSLPSTSPWYQWQLKTFNIQLDLPHSSKCFEYYSSTHSRDLIFHFYLVTNDLLAEDSGECVLYSNIVPPEVLLLALLSLILNCIRDFVEIADTAVNWFMFHISEIGCPPFPQSFYNLLRTI